DLDEGAAVARRVLVQGARDELLARARLARDQDGGRRVGDLLDDGVNLLDGGRLADQAEAAAARRLLGARVATRERERGQRLGDDLADLLLLEGLLQVVEGAQLDGLDGALDRAVRRYHDDR